MFILIAAKSSSLFHIHFSNLLYFIFLDEADYEFSFGLEDDACFGFDNSSGMTQDSTAGADDDRAFLRFHMEM